MFREKIYLTKCGLIKFMVFVVSSLVIGDFAGANSFQKRVRNIENHPVYHRLQPTDQTTTTHSLRNVFNQHREIVATKKVGHLGNSGKITLKKVKHPPVLDLGWGWKGKDLGWGWEIKENEESHKETEGWKKPEETEGWGWKKPEETEGWGWKKPEESEGWGWKKPEESEGWGWKKPEKEENELKKLIGVIGPVLFPLPFLLASLPLAVPAIGLTVLGKRRNITFQTLKPSTTTNTDTAAAEGRHNNVYTILQNDY